MALFYRLPPNKTLSNKKQVNGVKNSKERISVGVASNASGTDKCKLVVIGKPKKPRCFGNWNPQRVVHYFNNTKAWMTREIFTIWLERFNHQMHLEKRRVLLLLDNASGHGCINEEKYPNIQIEFLRPNATSHLQPMDAGIIRNLKLFYKKY